MQEQEDTEECTVEVQEDKEVLRYFLWVCDIEAGPYHQWKAKQSSICPEKHIGYEREYTSILEDGSIECLTKTGKDISDIMEECNNCTNANETSKDWAEVKWACGNMVK